jgi:hypothetical protein
MGRPDFPPFTPTYHPPPSNPARPGRLPRLVRPLNPLAQPFLPTPAAPPLPAAPLPAPSSPPPAPPDPDPPPPPEAADWWDRVAKPAIISFCQLYARKAASRRYHLRRFISRALELALETQDWPAVEAARVRLRTLDAAVAAGTAIRTHSPLLAEEEPGVFHQQAESRRGPSTGLCSVRTADGQVLTSPADVEREVSTYFEALFQGRHVASADESGFVDSGSTFRPNPDLFPGLLDGHTG